MNYPLYLISLRSLRNLLLTALALMLFSIVPAQAAGGATSSAIQSCTGQFPNFITDVCWSCMFPLKVGNATLASMGQEDAGFGESGGMVCTCSSPPRVGVNVSFWEPVRIVEVVRKPMCFPVLSGMSLPDPVGAPPGVRNNGEGGGFYHAHWYTNPLLLLLQVLLDFNTCLEEGSLDVAYMTELDPLWADPELTTILNPDVYLFANPISQAACGVDCVAATTGFPRSELFWCAGCQGSMYPLTGHVQHDNGAVSSSSLIVQRMSAKLHREGLVWGTWGNAGKCSRYPVPLMDKRAYKFQMISPANTTKVNGKCCHPFGRLHSIYGIGKELPAGQQDYVYQIFRKRQCCFSMGLL